MCSLGNSDEKIMWTPDVKKSTQSTQFRNLINLKYNLNLGNYDELHKWSVENYPKFWEEFWHFSKLVHSKPYKQVGSLALEQQLEALNKVINCDVKMEEIPEWFHGSTLNYAENLLSYRHKNSEKVALYATGEGQTEVRKVTFGQLENLVSRYVASIKKLGITTGDRVVGYLPNCVEAVVAMLATASLGAIWSCTSPDFGVLGVLERFQQIKPKLLFCVPAVVYNGKIHDNIVKVTEVVRGLSDLKAVVLVPFADTDRNNADISNVQNGMWLSHFLDLDPNVSNLEFVQVPFSHPLFIMFSSGTTGVPKCMVHSCGGTLIQHFKEHMLQGNTTNEDTVLFYTTTGWMMWNWMVSALAIGTSIVLYDGSPFANKMKALWDLIDTLNVTIYGTGAKWLSVMEENKIHPIETHSLKSLHMILSTGSPLKPQSYDYVYDKVKSDVLLGSISGGTDILGCFMGHSVDLPVHRGEIQCAFLGLAIECWDEEGKSVTGEDGELVCTKPHPSMPIRFWNDPDGVKYRNSYFSSSFKGVWCHGDYCNINPVTRGIVMLGRSDGTLNPNGVRFGSAEIYNIVESFAEIEDSLCVSQTFKEREDERVILFVKMAEQNQFGNDLQQRLVEAIRKNLSIRHVPALIRETKDIPYTINGKKVETAVRDILSGKQVKNRSVLRNPESLDFYTNMSI